MREMHQRLQAERCRVEQQPRQAKGRMRLHDRDHISTTMIRLTQANRSNSLAVNPLRTRHTRRYGSWTAYTLDPVNALGRVDFPLFRLVAPSLRRDIRWLG